MAKTPLWFCMIFGDSEEWLDIEKKEEKALKRQLKRQNKEYKKLQKQLKKQQRNK
jgi:hypothetical protein